MSSNEILIISLVVIICYFGCSVFKKFSDDRKQIRLAEIKNKEQKDLLENQVFLNQEETKRTEIITKAIRS